MNAMHVPREEFVEERGLTWDEIVRQGKQELYSKVFQWARGIGTRPTGILINYSGI
jgi:hypothetical protein